MGKAWRVGWTLVLLLLVEGLVCGLAALPVVLFWVWLGARVGGSAIAIAVLVSLLIVPSYVVFALCLLLVSPLATRVTGARTPRDAEMSMAELGWPLLAWVRAMVANHLVRLMAGALFRGSPIWTAYMRLSGARIGRRVYVNSVSISDFNLLEFGDDVVIGADAHLSGHTVEHGVVKTAAVRLAQGVTVGLQSCIEIDVQAGPGCQIGALSFVPKHARLEAGGVYAGIPVNRIR